MLTRMTEEDWAWKRFWRLSQAGVFEAFFDALAAMSQTAHLVQMLDSTVVRAHVSAAGANVWPAPSARAWSDLVGSVCIKRIRSQALAWPRWRSARPEPHKGVGIECHLAP